MNSVLSVLSTFCGSRQIEQETAPPSELLKLPADIWGIIANNLTFEGKERLNLAVGTKLPDHIMIRSMSSSLQERMQRFSQIPNISNYLTEEDRASLKKLNRLLVDFNQWVEVSKYPAALTNTTRIRFADIAPLKDRFNHLERAAEQRLTTQYETIKRAIEGNTPPSQLNPTFMQLMNEAREFGFPINSSRGNELLHLAVAHQKLEIVSDLLGAGANVNARDNRGNTAIKKAASLGNIHLLRILVEAKADLNAGQPLHTLLEIQCWVGAQYLIEQGADVNQSRISDYGLKTNEFPLYLAIANNAPAYVIKDILDHCKGPESQLKMRYGSLRNGEYDSNYPTLFHWILRSQDRDLILTAFPFANPSDVDCLSIAKAGKKDILQILAKKVDLGKVPEILPAAVSSGNLETVQYVLRMGTRVSKEAIIEALRLPKNEQNSTILRVLLQNNKSKYDANFLLRMNCYLSEEQIGALLDGNCLEIYNECPIIPYLVKRLYSPELIQRMIDAGGNPNGRLHNCMVTENSLYILTEMDYRNDHERSERSEALKRVLKNAGCYEPGEYDIRYLMRVLEDEKLPGYFY